MVDVFVTCVMNSLPEFLAKSDEYVYKLADNFLDALTNGEHSKTLKETAPVSKYTPTAENIQDVTTKNVFPFFSHLFSLPFQQQVIEERNSQPAQNDTEV